MARRAPDVVCLARGMRGRVTRWLMLGLMLVALAGCAGKATVKAAPQPTANPETSYRLVSPPGAARYTLQPGQSATQPAPEIGYFAPPVYPPSLAHPGMPPVQVIAHLVFDVHGKVAAVTIVADTDAGTGHALFEDAVRKAVQGWAFTPLVFTETTGGATPVTLKHEAKPFSLWFEFEFKMVHGEPRVSTRRNP